MSSQKYESLIGEWSNADPSEKYHVLLKNYRILSLILHLSLILFGIVITNAFFVWAIVTSLVVFMIFLDFSSFSSYRVLLSNILYLIGITYVNLFNFFALTHSKTLFIPLFKISFDNIFQLLIAIIFTIRFIVILFISDDIEKWSNKRKPVSEYSFKVYVQHKSHKDSYMKQELSGIAKRKGNNTFFIKIVFFPLLFLFIGFIIEFIRIIFIEKLSISDSFYYNYNPFYLVILLCVTIFTYFLYLLIPRNLD